MAHHRVAEPLPPAYRGKEPSYIKHELLKAYLKRLFLIIGMSAQRLGILELCYVDAFAGPWLDESSAIGGPRQLFCYETIQCAPLIADR